MDVREVQYYCIFDVGKFCPAKTAFKLKPESLVEFCKICAENKKWDTLAQATSMFMKIQTGTDKPDMELEKLRMQHELDIKKLENENEALKLKLNKDLKE